MRFFLFFLEGEIKVLKGSDFFRFVVGLCFRGDGLMVVVGRS